MRGMVLVFLACVLVAGPSGCGESSLPKKNSGVSSLRVAYLPYLSFAPVLVAEENGLFKNYGLEVDFVNIRRTHYGTAALANGKLDVGGGAVSAGLFNLIARGLPVRIVADKGHVPCDGHPYGAVLVRNDLVKQGMLQQPERLRQMRLASPRQTISSMFVDLGLTSHGLSIDDFKVLSIPGPARLPAMAAGQVELMFMGEPWLTRAVEDGHSRVWIGDDEVIPGFQYSVLIFGPELLERRPEIGLRFMAAYLEGVRCYREGKTERNLAILQRHTNLSRELLKRATWPGIRADGAINVESVLEFQKWAAAKGLMENPLRPEEFWEPRFVEEAAQGLTHSSGEIGPMKQRPGWPQP